MTSTSGLSTATLMGATLTTAMVAGLLFCFAHSVMPGLGTLNDPAFLTAFQRIDAAISNPWMMLTFLGSPALIFLALLQHLPDRQPLPSLIIALVLSAATVIITAAIHLPLNAAIQDAAFEFLNAGLRSLFEDRWVRWNVVRTATSIGSLTAMCWALFIAGKSAA